MEIMKISFSVAFIVILVVIFVVFHVENVVLFIYGNHEKFW